MLKYSGNLSIYATIYYISYSTFQKYLKFFAFNEIASTIFRSLFLRDKPRKCGTEENVLFLLINNLTL